MGEHENGAAAINKRLNFWSRVQVPAPYVAIIVLVALISGDTIWDSVESYFGFQRPKTDAEIVVECVDRTRRVPREKMNDMTFRMVINNVCSGKDIVSITTETR